MGVRGFEELLEDDATSCGAAARDVASIGGCADGR